MLKNYQRQKLIKMARSKNDKRRDICKVVKKFYKIIFYPSIIIIIIIISSSVLIVLSLSLSHSCLQILTLNIRLTIQTIENVKKKVFFFYNPFEFISVHAHHLHHHHPFSYPLLLPAFPTHYHHQSFERKIKIHSPPPSFKTGLENEKIFFF